MTNPFGTTFESLDGPTGPVVESIHRKAYAQLRNLIGSGEGHFISLRAPRAGYGKTMLLSRLGNDDPEDLIVLPIRLAEGCRVEGEGTLEELLTRLCEPVEAGGSSRLDFLTRRLFSRALLPLIDSGEVPCQDQEETCLSLQNDPVTAFDFHRKNASIAQWTAEQFDLLLPRLSETLSKEAGLSVRNAAYWLEHLFHYASRASADSSRTSDLIEIVFGGESRFRSGAGFFGGLGTFLNLVTLVDQVVLVLDEVDGLSGDTESAMRVTSSLVSLREAAPCLTLVVSVNDDVWESAFVPRLPLGLRDRLEDHVIRLGELSVDEARELISTRGGKDAPGILEQLTLTSGGLYPRGVLRVARDLWEPTPDDLAPSSVASIPPVQESKEAPSIPGARSAALAAVVSPPPAPSSSDAAEKKPPRTLTEPQSIRPPATHQAAGLSLPPQVPRRATAPVSAKAGTGTPFTPPPRPTYPPASVKRASLPRKFEVKHLSPAPDSSPSPSPFYPPAQVKRIGLPRKFEVKRLSPEPVSSSYPPAGVKPVALPQQLKVERILAACAPYKSPFRIASPARPQPLAVTPTLKVVGEASTPALAPKPAPPQPSSESSPFRPRQNPTTEGTPPPPAP